MTDHLLTDGFDQRLRKAMNHGPRPASIRRLAERLQEAYPNLRGSSYGGVRYYYEGGPEHSEPRMELLRAMSDVLGVRPEWLAYGEGAMTRDEQLAQEASEEARAALETGAFRELVRQVEAALTEEIPRLRSGLTRTRNRIAGLIEILTARPDFHLRHRDLVAFDRLPNKTGRVFSVEADFKEAAVREAARAIKAPAEELGVDLDGLSEAHFDLYVDAQCSALAVLLARPQRMGHSTPKPQRASPEGIEVDQRKDDE